jgi:peptide/nickel transport system ATP-binding protein
MANLALQVDSLRKHYPLERGMFHDVTGTIKAVDGVSFTVQRGEACGIVGESGSGKTTIGRCIVRVTDATSGSILVWDENDDRLDIVRASKNEMRRIRKSVQMIFQDPYASLDPRMTVYDIVAEPLIENRIAKGGAVRERVEELIQLVGLNKSQLGRYPHAFSGGQRQRIGIARALAVSPRLVVADEAVSALDVSVQAQILNLMMKLQQDLQLSMVFIAHDLSVVKHMCDQVIVMYAGRIVERARTPLLFSRPRHPYSEALLSAIPKLSSVERKKRIVLKGEPPNPTQLPPGCHFHPRCQYAKDICRQVEPPLIEISPEQTAACHFAKELNLVGAGDS